ncbi:conserved hypothetical protein [Histoplasma capsulatum var. duboisii H88]|uniref:Malate dehydrogenase n=1 Tax=Ajellomyces capsulatus (strain H88) TaxID=544711 RepID=F0UG36_AJEC8|nr:conserved hypothetical protein [Histoplasma capsulatum var. duboisii H88]QSS55022.1 malate dehydrogenase [Histoplasma capsulatum var. duboisii H88]
MQLVLVLAALASLTSVALAAPPGWSPDSAQFYSTVAKEIEAARKSHKDPSRKNCDFSRAKLPAPTKPLPPVPQGQKLLHVTIGRGIQNYTCASSSASDTPKATGALATLFEATCLAATFPRLLALLPRIALHMPKPTYPQSKSSPSTRSQPDSNFNLDLDFDFDLDPLTFGPSNMPIAGYHYFDSTGVPVFDLLADGHSAVAKVADVPAPKDALKGVGRQMFGAVAWLYLAAVDGSSGKAKSVYRVATAGGKAPATCNGWKGNDGDGGVLSVEYSAEYWFFG